jgi:amino acid adenylation domain-containing protein
MNSQVIHTVFEEQASIHSDRIAIHQDRKVITYFDLNRNAKYLTGVLMGLGLLKETVVGVLLPSGIDLITAMLANFKAGTIYMPLDLAFGRRRLQEIFRQCVCKVIITSSELKEQLMTVLAELGVEVDTIVIVDGKYTVILKYNEGRFVQTEIPVDREVRVPDPDDSNYIFCTSGTTGACKATVGSHRGLYNFIDWENREFNIDHNFRVSQLTSATFDASLRDVFTALSTGGTVYIPPEAVRLNIPALIEWLEENRITLIHCVPSLFKLLTKELASRGKTDRPVLRDLRYIIMAGEPLFCRDAKGWYDTVGHHVELVNMYGTTETTLAKTFHRIGELPENPFQVLHVGKPIDGAEILIMNGGKPCRPGEIGEVYIRTPFISKGYYNQQPLTDTVFVQNPLSDQKDIIHRTGDMGKYLRDRSVEISGRMDDQVKINGIRIELKEIELAVLSIDRITEAIVIPFKDKESQYELICYYIGENINEEDLRKYLERELPGYLVPSFFVKFDSFPLTINGKIDKKALPKPRQLIERKSKYEAPVNETEKGLEDIWEEVLGIKDIGRKTSFFEMGGNSIKSLLVIAKIYKVYGVLIKIDVIFTHRTIEGIAKYIFDGQQEAFRCIPHLADKEYYDLSNSQKRAWIQSQTQAESALYNVAGAYSFEGELNFEIFKKAFQSMVERHEILRTTFLLVDGQPRQKVNPYSDLYKVDYTDLTGTDNGEETAVSIISRTSNSMFDLEHGPLFNAMLIQLSATMSIFSLTLHHIISDAWSMEILTSEMFILYNTYCNKEENPLTPLRIQYKDYADWQNRQLLGNWIFEYKQFWLGQFKDKAPVFGLPTNFQRPGHRTYEAATVLFEIDSELKQDLEKLSLKADATLFMTFVAVLNVVVCKHTGQNDITLGSPVAGREHPDLENQVGFYVNTLPIRTKVEVDTDFTHFLGKVRNSIVEILKYQIYPFDQLVDDLNIQFARNRSPMFDLGFTYIKENEFRIAQKHTGLTGIKVKYLNSEFNLVKADIWFKVLDNSENCIVDISYNSNLFSPLYIKNLTSDIQNVLSAVTADPEIKISELIALITSLGTRLEREKGSVLKSKNLESLKQIVKEGILK